MPIPHIPDDEQPSVTAEADAKAYDPPELLQRLRFAAAHYPAGHPAIRFWAEACLVRMMGGRWAIEYEILQVLSDRIPF